MRTLVNHRMIPSSFISKLQILKRKTTPFNSNCREPREKTVAVERAIKAEQERNQPAPPRGKEDDNEGGITNKDLQM